MNGERPQHIFRIDAQKRVETGGVQFENDFPGYFIRGDDCLQLLHGIGMVISKIEELPDENKKAINFLLNRFIGKHVKKIQAETIGKYTADISDILERNTIVTMFAEWTAFSAIRSGYPPPKTRKDVYPLIKTPDYNALFDLSKWDIQPTEFDQWHERNTEAIISKRPNLPVGWATKLINVYLKCRVYVARQGRANLINCIHPPIDNGLWKGIADKYKHDTEVRKLTHIVNRIKNIKTYEDYKTIIKGCRLISEHLKCRLIEVEQLWKGTE